MLSWALMSSPVRPQRDDPHYLVVRSGGHRCAIPVDAAKLVTGAVRLSPLPGSASRLLGLAQVAGEPVAVVDLHALLDVTGERGGGHELTVVVRRPDGSATLGLAVDEAFGVTTIESLRPAADDDPRWVAARSTVDGREILLLDPERLFEDRNGG